MLNERKKSQRSSSYKEEETVRKLTALQTTEKQSETDGND